MNPRLSRSIGPVILVVSALVAVVVGLAYGGGAVPTILKDMGPVVRWGLPITTLLMNLAAAAMVGPLVLALFALSPEQKAFTVAVDTASAAAATFTITAGITGYLTVVNVLTPEDPFSADFGATLGRFLTENELGRTWLITVVAGAIVTIITFLTRGWTATLVTAALALATLVPIATQGHSGDLANHNIAVTSLVLHTVGAAVWVGGLLLLVIARPIMRSGMVDVLARYSTIALVAFIVVAGSGVARAAIGVVSWSGLASPYGVLVIVKVLLLLAIGAFGAIYRRRLLPRAASASSTRAFWTLVVAELALMGLASGVAAALARTKPPSADQNPLVSTPAELLTGAPLPPELTPGRLLTQWNIDLLWVFVVAFGVFFYVAGVLRLRRRGDHWPIYRTIMWILGLAALLWVTCGPVNAYQQYLFSMHMLGHMLLTMGVPGLLVAGAPVTLAVRAIRKRTDGSRGMREWILWAVHSPYGKLLTHPIVAAAIFVASLWIFYYTDLFRWSVYDHLGHEWMTVHFLISGYLFVLSLIGIDPVPYRFPYAGRLITLIAVAAMHAFFGIAIMMQTGLMVAEWYGSMARPWGPTPMEDQYIGGGIAWSIGEIPTLIVAITVAIQWSRSDERAQKRRDRHADRTGDAELAEYNARLARIAERDQRTSG